MKNENRSEEGRTSSTLPLKAAMWRGTVVDISSLVGSQFGSAHLFTNFGICCRATSDTFLSLAGRSALGEAPLRDCTESIEMAWALVPVRAHAICGSPAGEKAAAVPSRSAMVAIRTLPASIMAGQTPRLCRCSLDSGTAPGPEQGGTPMVS